MTLVFHGNDTDQGLTLYHNHSEIKDPMVNVQDEHPPGSGHIVIGRRYTNKDSHYSSILIDDFILWNWPFTQDDVDAMFGM